MHEPMRSRIGERHANRPPSSMWMGAVTLISLAMGIGCASVETPLESNRRPAPTDETLSDPNDQTDGKSPTAAISQPSEASATSAARRVSPEAAQPEPSGNSDGFVGPVPEGGATRPAVEPSAEDGPAAPPVGTWNRGDSVAATVADQAILESDVYEQAKLLAGGDREPSLAERQGVLLQLVQQELMKLYALQKFGERGIQIAQKLAQERRDEQIAEMGYLEYERRTEAAGSTLKEDAENRVEAILMDLARSDIRNRHLGEYRHLQVSPQEIQAYYTEHFERDFAATPPVVELEIVLFPRAGEDPAAASAFAEAWRADPDIEIPEGRKVHSLQIDFAETPSWPEWIDAFARSAAEGEVSDPLEGSADYRPVVRVRSRTETPEQALSEPEVQELIRNRLLAERLESVVAEDLLASLPQIAIWPPAVKLQVRQQLTR